MRSPWVTAAMLATAGVVVSGGAALATPPDVADRHEAARQAAEERLRDSGASPVIERQVRVQICTNGVCVVHECDGPECVAPAPTPPGPAEPSPAAVGPGPPAEPTPEPDAVAPVPGGAALTARLSGTSSRRGVVVGLLSERSGSVTLVVRASWTAADGRRREILLGRRRAAVDAGVPRELRLAAGARELRRIAGATKVRIRVTARGAMRTQVVLRPRSSPRRAPGRRAVVPRRPGAAVRAGDLSVRRPSLRRATVGASAPAASRPLVATGSFSQKGTSDA